MWGILFGCWVDYLPKREIVASQYQSSETGTEANLLVDASELRKAEGGDGSEGSTPESISVFNERIQRLVDYTSDILLQSLKKVLAKRARKQKRSAQTDKRIKKLENRPESKGSAPETALLPIHQ